MLARLFRIVGRRVAWSFGGVIFVLVFLMAALQVASRNALREYVGDQLARVPWDIFPTGTRTARNPGEYWKRWARDIESGKSAYLKP